MVFKGASDGKLYAVSSTDGTLLWEFNTAQEFETVNKVPAHGGAISVSGAVVAGRMVFVGSGYAVGSRATAGNVCWRSASTEAQHAIGGPFQTACGNVGRDCGIVTRPDPRPISWVQGVRQVIGNHADARSCFEQNLISARLAALHVWWGPELAWAHRLP